MVDQSFTSHLHCARELADSVFEPNAQQTDQAGSPPIGHIDLLSGARLIGLSTPTQFGGLGAPQSIMREYTEILAGACGVTTFVQGQHQSAALLIAGGQNDALKRELLPRMATGERLCGVAFAHVRRFGEPILRAEEVMNGYRLNGTAPWFTGWGVLREVVLGATLPDGRLLYAAAPLDTPGLSASPPMRLCAMNASGTVSLTCSNVQVSPERVIKVITREQMAANDEAAILGVLAQPFGVAGAAIRLIRSQTRDWNRHSFAPAADSLYAELCSVRAAANVWYERNGNPEYKANALAVRARAIDLGVRAAHAALAASAGRGNALDHPAQRLFREAMFYTLTAQTPDVQAATLARVSTTLCDA